MYIPTQEERYSKAARWTLLLCLVVPSAVVLWLYGGDEANLTLCLTAFLQPIAGLLVLGGCTNAAALCLSATLQGVLFVLLARRKNLTPKTKLTICITWGMLTALILRLMLAGWLS